MSKWAWLIGASDGLGFASAQRLLHDGWSVVVSSRPSSRLDEACNRLAAIGEIVKRPFTLGLDDLPAVAAEVDAQCGGLGAVVLSGGGPPPARAMAMTPEALETAYRLVLEPAAMIVATIGQKMAERRDGVIILITSSGVAEPIPGLAPSNIMRAGVTALMKTAARELAEHDVRLVCVAPGRIDTSRVAALDSAASSNLGVSIDEIRARSEAAIGMRRYGRPAEFAAVVGWLCGSEATYVTGTTISVDGGKSIGLLN